MKVTNDGWKDEDSDKMKEANLLLRREEVQDLFKGYYYDQSFESIRPSQGYIIPQRRGQPSRTTKPSPSRTMVSNSRKANRSNSGMRKSKPNLSNNIASASTEEGKNNI